MPPKVDGRHVFPPENFLQNIFDGSLNMRSKMFRYKGMSFKINALRVDNWGNLVASHFHEYVYSEIHFRDSLRWDHKRTRKAIRNAVSRIEFKGVKAKTIEKALYKMAYMAYKSRVPPGRTEKSTTELRKNGGYKGIVNPPSELQAIVQALPERYFLKEQDALYSEIQDWLDGNFPGAAYLVTLHTDKVRLHVEFVILKFGKTREALECFKGFRHDGTGVAGKRAVSAIKGKKFSKEEKSKMKINSLADIRFSLNMRVRLFSYLREMSRDERRKTLEKARKIAAHLDRTMHERSKKRRLKQAALEPARRDFERWLDTEKNRDIKAASLTTIEKPTQDVDRLSLIPKEASSDCEDITHTEEVIEASMPPQQDAPLKYHDLINGRDVSQPNDNTVLRDDLDDFNEYREQKDVGAILRAANGDINESMRQLIESYRLEKGRNLQIENEQQHKMPDPEI